MQTLLILLFLAMIIVGCISATEDVTHAYDANAKPEGTKDDKTSGSAA